MLVAIERPVDPTRAAAIAATIRGIRRMMSIPLMLTRIECSGEGPVGETTLLTTIPIIPQWEIAISRRTEPSGHDDGDGGPRDARLVVRCYREGDLRLAVDAVEAHVECDQPRRAEVARHVLAAAQTALARIAAGGTVVDAEDAAAAAWMHVELVLGAIDADRNGMTVIGPAGAMANPARTMMTNAISHLDVPWPGPFADRSLGGDRRQPSHAGHPVREAGIPVVVIGIDDGVVTLRQVVAIHSTDPVDKLRMIGRDARFRDAITQLGMRP